METLEKTLPQYLEELGVTITATRCDMPANPIKWQERSYAWRIIIKRNNLKTSCFFFTGYERPKLTPADVLYCLAADWGYSSMTLQQFGDELGWNDETVKIYRGVCREAKKIARLFTEDELSTINEIGY